MITVVGTGHVFRLQEQILFLTKHIWPDCVLVELDYTRYKMLTESPKEGQAEEPKEKPKKDPWIYRNTARYQKRMAEDHRSGVGQELVTAVNAGRLLGAEIGFIDTNAANTVAEMWEEMSFGEKTRYTLSSIKDRIVGKRGVEKAVKNFSENEDKVMEDMRRRYPTLVRKLIDERNEYMAGQIRTYTDRFSNILVVCGDAHVEGICSLLSDQQIFKIRLGDIVDEERFKIICRTVWDFKGGETE